jgi:hypothetical protein
MRSSEIQREQDSFAIIELLQRHQVSIDNGDIEFLTQSVFWDSKSIAYHLNLSSEIIRVIRALEYLVSKQWIQKRKSQYFLTIFGIESYYQESKSPAIDTGSEYQKWKFSAVYGTDANGKQSKLENAADIKNVRYDDHRNKEQEAQERNIARSEHIRRIAEENGESEADTRRMMESGEIKSCPMCGKIRKHHRDGTRFRKICIECRNKQRRKVIVLAEEKKKRQREIIYDKLRQGGFLETSDEEDKS